MYLHMIPHETSLQWVYFPPFFFAVLLGLLSAVAVMMTLNRQGWIRFFANPGVVFLAFWVLLSSLFGFVLPP